MSSSWKYRFSGLGLFVALMLVVMQLSGIASVQAAAPTTKPQLAQAMPQAYPPQLSSDQSSDVQTKPQQPEDMLYDQAQLGQQYEVVSSNHNPISVFDSQGADDFVVPAGRTWTITQVKVYGVHYTSEGIYAVSVYFYNNAGTLPGTPVLSQTINGLRHDDPDFLLSLTIPAVLTAGTYWVSVVPTVYSVEWEWHAESVQTGNGAAWRNPGNGYGTGCTNWTTRPSGTCNSGGAGPDNAFQLIGSSVGGPPATNTPTNTPTATNVPPTNTPTNTATDTPVPPTDTPTDTPVPPTDTPTASPTPCLGANMVQNPGFETGSFAPWVISDTVVPAAVSTAQAHSGTQSALIGNLSGTEPNGDGSIYQQVTVPAGSSTLSYWYWPFSQDTITFDWMDAYVENTSGTILATVMHVDSNTQVWTNQTFDMTPYAGQTVRIVFLVHEDGFGDVTAMYVDDIAIQAPASCGTPISTVTPGGPTNTSIPVTSTPTDTPAPTDTTLPTQTPGGPTATTAPPTDTPAPATNTSVPATNTPVVTNTPGGPTDTPAPTNTVAMPTATPTDCPNVFTDITGNIFYNAIHYLNCRGVINGTDATHYSPARTSTRGQFAKVVVLGFGLASYTPAAPDFSDVPPDYFAYLYIESGYHAGILSGFDRASCQAAGQPYPCYLPNRAITRGQLTKLVVGAAHYPFYTPTSGQPSFSDVPPSNVFFISIESAHYKGVINGYADGTFRPNNNIRRDEMAQIVYKGVTTP